MKKLLPILFSLLSLSAFATHERAGEITYKYLGGYTYEITVATYTKPESYLADRCTITIHFGDGDSAVVCRSNYEPGDPDNFLNATCSNNTSCSTHHMGEWSMILPCMDSKKNVYTTTHTFPGSWAFVISCTDPNRVDYIKNIPTNSSLSLSLSDTLIINPFVVGNSSPVFSNLAIDTAYPGICHTYNPGATDPDGDSLSYELVPCEDSPGHPIAGYFVPAGISLNAISGDLTWCSPTSMFLPQPDLYNFAIRVKEWRKIGENYIRIGTVTRDIQFLVNACAPMAVNEIESNLLGITIYPNPLSVQATLQVQESLKNATLTIYNSFGQTVKQIKNISGQKVILSRDNLPSGLYFIRLTQDNKTFATDKLVLIDN